MTQVYFSGHALLSSFLAFCSFEIGGCCALLVAFPVRSKSVGGESEFEEGLLKSKVVPGVFGVLLEDPNAAKAPDPSPNAADALGDATVFVFNCGAPF